MALLSILEVPDPVLRQVSEPVGTVDDAVRTLVADMFETMYAAPGIGLAAIQVGIARRILVIDLQEEEDAGGEPVRRPRVFIDPELDEFSDTLSIYTEGCLSIPEQFADVERPAECRVRWTDEHGARHEERVDGLLATCLQHEVDHLDGVLFLDHISRLKRSMLMKRLAKARRDA